MSEAMKRVWLVTGANSGFGQAIVEAAIAAGDVVVATARRPSVLDDLVGRYPGQVDSALLDVTDASGIEATVKDVLRRHGRIDVLVNNAGRTHVGALEETTDAELRSLFEVHLFGPAALTRAVLPHMRSRGSGAIVQLSSMGGQLSFAGFSAYSATKFAFEGLSEALADEVRPFGINVLVVEPGAFGPGCSPMGAKATRSRRTRARSARPGGWSLEVAGPSRAIQPKQPRRSSPRSMPSHTPLRLPLGNDAVDAIFAHLDGVRAEITAWEKVARDTVFDD